MGKRKNLCGKFGNNKRLNLYVLAMLIELLWFQKVSAQSWFLCSRNTSPLYSILKHGSWSGHQITLYF